MKKPIATFLATIAVFAASTKAQVPGPLKLVQTINLPGLADGDFDHFAIDSAGQRLFVAAEENSRVLVIDLRSNRMIRAIEGPKAPHSLAYDADSKKLFVVDDGGPSQVEVYDGTSFELSGSIPMEAHADPSVYDAANKLLYVGNGGKDANKDYCLISVIDTRKAKKVADIRVDSDHVESMAIEKSGPRLFVNQYAKGAIAVIDRNKREVIANWSIARDGRNNGPMAFDEADHRLFVYTRDTGKVVVLDSDTGATVATISCVGSYDEALYDPQFRRLYLVGVPFLRVFQKIDKKDRYDALGQVATAFHAETGILDPQSNLLYMVVNHHGDTDAIIQVYKIVP